MKKALLFFFAAVCLGGGWVRPQAKASPAGTEVVPERFIQGNKLVLPALYCSVASPWKNARWLRRVPDNGKVHAYYCVEDTEHKVLILVVNTHSFRKFDDRAMSLFVKGITAPFQRNGWKSQGARFQESPLPVAGASYNFTCKMTREGASPLVLQGTVVSGHFLYAIQGFAPGLKRDADLKSFIHSFRLTKDAPPPRTDFRLSVRTAMRVNISLAFFMMLLYAALLFGFPALSTAGGFGRREHPRMHRWVLVGGSLALLAVHLAAQAGLVRQIGPELTPEILGQLLGSAVMAFAVPLALFLWIEGRRKEEADMLR